MDAAAARRRETWDWRDGDRVLLSTDVDVRIGKPLDVLALKGTSLPEIGEYAAFLQQTAADLYGPARGRRHVEACPCCAEATATATVVATIFGVDYRRCAGCGHAFVADPPETSALEAVFAQSEDHSSVYVDRSSLEVRLAQVVQPKLAWLQEVYAAHRGRAAARLLDVGAGGGHFVEICRRQGLSAAGYEISRSSRRFAQEAFGIDLRPDDFLAAAPEVGAFDVVTFWGLLEYTPEPARFVEAARRILDPATGLLVVEVPRFDCLSTAVQREQPQAVARHLDPTSHVNCFSDASLATLLAAGGFRPVAAWYFGLDAYEFLVSLSLSGGGSLLERFAPLVPGLQAAMDAALLCDDVVVAAVPF
jgi:2-polyprenyl-3-methyl-5-hydroxy-6-metoxy-1,4-benzoquinol methylase